MTTKTVLTDAEIIAIGHQARAIESGENGYILPVTFARAIEQAILQSEQSQATEAYPCRIVETDFETNTVTLEMQGKYTVSSGPKYLCDVPLYKCPDFSCKGKLDSSSAGGVSGRITSKTIEQHREEFELWLSSVETRGATDFERYMEDGFYIDWDVQRAWISWKAARGITE